MSLITGGQSDFFGLDIGTVGIRAVQLHGAGPIKTLERYGEIAIFNSIAGGNAVADQERLKQAVSQLMSQTGISTRNVAINVPSQKVFTTIIDLPKMVPAEIEKTIRYQAESFIPTPLAKSKIDWVVIGSSPTGADKVEVLLTSVANDFVEERLAMVEAAGLNVVAMEPDNMALTRAVTAPDMPAPQMVLDIGSVTSDLLIVANGLPHLARSIPTGSMTIIRAAAQNLSIDEKQAQQYVFKFGLGKDKLDGKVYAAIITIIDGLIAEMEKSIKFFQGRYGEVKLDRIIVTGGASTLPELPLYIANKFGLNVEIGNPWRNVSVPAERQNETMSAASHFGVAVGLAERSIV